MNTELKKYNELALLVDNSFNEITDLQDHQKIMKKRSMADSQ